MTIRVIHYVNQFFAGVGGEEKAGVGPDQKPGAVGPGMALKQLLGDKGEVVGTVYCGDNYVNEHPEAVDQIVDLIAALKPDLVVVGPAFDAGRYGIACGLVGAAVQERLKVPAVTGMHEENPGVDMYRKQVYIVPTGQSAVKMREALGAMVALGLKLVEGARIGTPAEGGYFARGLRFTRSVEQPAAVRAVEMLLKALRGDQVETEWPGPNYDRVTPPKPIGDMTHATIALVTSSGVMRKGNPDHIESTFATKWLKYDLNGVNDLNSPRDWETIHGGYDTRHVNANPNRVLPVDILREFEKSGALGKLHNTFYTTVGSGQSTTNAKKFAQEIIVDLKKSQVDGVIFVAT